MAPAERTLKATRDRSLEQWFRLWRSSTWEEEVEDALEGAREAAGRHAADPDWLAASSSLARHCSSMRVAAARWSAAASVTLNRPALQFVEKA